MRAAWSIRTLLVFVTGTALLLPPAAWANRSATVWGVFCNVGGERVTQARTLPGDALGDPRRPFLNWHVTLAEGDYQFRFASYTNFTINAYWRRSGNDQWQVLGLPTRPGVNNSAARAYYDWRMSVSTHRGIRQVLVQALPDVVQPGVGITADVVASNCAPAPPTTTGGGQCPPGTQWQASPLGQSGCVPVP